MPQFISQKQARDMMGKISHALDLILASDPNQATYGMYDWGYRTRTSVTSKDINASFDRIHTLMPLLVPETTLSVDPNIQSVVAYFETPPQSAHDRLARYTQAQIELKAALGKPEDEDDV